MSGTQDAEVTKSLGKILLFWTGGGLWEVVAYEMWSLIEVQLYWQS